jgi:hypothetical protein
MPARFPSAAALLLACFWSATAFSADDTARLAMRLKSVRGSMWLPADQYRSLQTEYLAWIDTRLKIRESPEKMNRELEAAGLLISWSDTPDEMDKSHAGYVGAIKKREFQGTKDVFVIEAGIFRGGGCSLDVTAVVYERGPLARLAEINASPDAASYLSGLDVSGKDEAGRRLLASGWVISHCTSTWNGKTLPLWDTIGKIRSHPPHEGEKPVSTFLKTARLWMFGLVVGFYTTFVLENLWNWFVATTLHTNEISYWEMFGFNMLLQMVLEKNSAIDDSRWKVMGVVVYACVPPERKEEVDQAVEEENQNIWLQAGSAVFGKLMGNTATLGIGWAVHTFMT